MHHSTALVIQLTSVYIFLSVLRVGFLGYYNAISHIANPIMPVLQCSPRIPEDKSGKAVASAFPGTTGKQ